MLNCGGAPGGVVGRLVELSGLPQIWRCVRGLAMMRLNAVKTPLMTQAQKLCRLIGAPAEFGGVLQASLVMYCSSRAKDSFLDHERFQACMIEQRLRCFHDIGMNINSSEVDLLISRLRAVN